MQTILKKKSKGFTLIELIVVIAIIGILVLLAMPKFMDYTKEAKMAQIKHDIKVAETVTDEYLSIESKLPEDLDVPDMDTPLAEGRLFEIRGVATAIIGDAADYRDVTTMDEVRSIRSIRSKLPGQFIANENGKVYYIHDKAIDIGESLPDLTIAEDQPYMDVSVPTLASIWGEDAKEVMAMVTALEGVGVSVPTKEDALNLYQDLKVADPELLSKMVAVQPQVWTGNYSEVTGDLNNIKDGLFTFLTGVFGTLHYGDNIVTAGTNFNFNSIPITGQFAHTYNQNILKLYVNGSISNTWTQTNTNSLYSWSSYNVYQLQVIDSSTSRYYVRVLRNDGVMLSNSWIINNTFGLSPGTYTPQVVQQESVESSISADAPVLDTGYNAATDRWYPEAPWLGAYSDTWQDVKMAKSGNKDIYLGTIDRYINDMVNVLTWDNVDDISYYGGGSAATTALTVTSDGLLEVTVPE